MWQHSTAFLWSCSTEHNAETDRIKLFHFAKWPNTKSCLWSLPVLLHPEKTNQKMDQDVLSLSLWASPGSRCSYDFWMFQHIFSSLWFFWGYMGGCWQNYTNTVFTAQQSLDPDLELNVGGIGVNANKKDRTVLLLSETKWLSTEPLQAAIKKPEECFVTTKE